MNSAPRCFQSTVCYNLIFTRHRTRLSTPLGTDDSVIISHYDLCHKASGLGRRAKVAAICRAVRLCLQVSLGAGDRVSFCDSTAICSFVPACQPSARTKRPEPTCQLPSQTPSCYVPSRLATCAVWQQFSCWLLNRYWLCRGVSCWCLVPFQ